MAADQDSYAQGKTSTVLCELGQRLVTLSCANRDALLAEAAGEAHGDESRAHAVAILNSLNKLTPELAQQFQPKHDALANLNFRLICSASSPSSHPSVDNVPSFIAVSYCWHNDQWHLPAAAVPAVPAWGIARPMMESIMGLPELRHSPDEEVHVWLDSLCINQGDSEDVVAHLGIMDAIYRTARQVVILLEDVQLEDDEEQAGLAFAGVYADLGQEVSVRELEGQERSRFVKQYFPRREKGLDAGILSAAKPFAMKMMGARWYSRAWCAHESRMMKHQKINNPLFLCFGSDGRVLSFEFRFIHYLGLYLCSQEPDEDIHDPRYAEAVNDPNPTTLRQLWWRMQRLMPDAKSEISAMQHLVNVLSAGCSKKGDLLSITLNTAGIPLCYAGEDIPAVEEVVWKFATLVLAAGDLAPLVANGQKLRLPAADGSIVSWLTDPDRSADEALIPNPLPDSITAITREYIELDLLVFESLPQQATSTSQAKATDLIAEHNLDAVADEMLVSLPEPTQLIIRQTAAETRQTLRHSLLSLALDNGLDWLLAFPTAMQKDTSTWLHGPVGRDTNPALLPAAHFFLTHLNNNTTTNPQPTQETSHPLPTLTQALTTLLDARFSLLTPNPRRLPLHPALGTALLTPAGTNRAYIAVPAALAHLPGWLDRAWLVEPFDPAADPEEGVLRELLPPPELRVARAGEEEGMVEDVFPVLGSDYEDRRAVVDFRGLECWRLRRKQGLCGACEGVWGEESAGREMLTGEGDGRLRGGGGVVLMRRQRVYGAEDYPWGRMGEALRRVFGAGAAGV